MTLPPGVEAAPLDLALDAGQAAGGQALFTRTRDGLRLRIGLWSPPGARGTVLLFPGRTEYIEKYSPFATDLAARDYSVAVIDWRGQGLSDRLLDRPTPGHIDRFGDYQTDVAALTDVARASGLPKPWFLLAHSMGGTIALRALLNGLPVQAAAFSAPMWGIELGAIPHWAARAVSATARRLGMGGWVEPGSARQTLPLTSDHPHNLLTSDLEQFTRLCRHAADRPDLMVGGPTFSWVGEALAECRALAHLPSPALPALAAIGSDEAMVDPAPIRARMADWPGGRLVDFPGARHEVMMESPATRARFLNAIDDLFHKARA